MKQIYTQLTYGNNANSITVPARVVEDQPHVAKTKIEVVNSERRLSNIFLIAFSYKLNRHYSKTYPNSLKK